MYFYKEGGKQYLDLRGNLIISHNPDIVRTRVPSAAPAGVHNLEKYIMAKDLTTLRRKLKALWVCAKFIFDSKRSFELKPTVLHEEIDQRQQQPQ